MEQEHRKWMRTFNWLFFSQVFMFVVTLLILVWHALAPGYLLWLTGDQIRDARITLGIFFGAAILLIFMYKGAEIHAKAEEAQKEDEECS